MDDARRRRRHRWPLVDDGAVVAQGLGPTAAQAPVGGRDVLHPRRHDHLFLLENEIRTATKGAFINVARNTRHAFRVDSATARFLNGYTPASMEALVAELGRRTEQRTLPPPEPVATGGSMPDELRDRYGLSWLAEPDPLEPREH